MSTSTVATPTDTPTSSGDSVQLLKIAEAAKVLSVSPWFMAELCKSGAIDSVYISHKARRIRRDVLDAYIDALPTERPRPEAD